MDDSKKPPQTDFHAIPQFSGDRPSVPAAIELDSVTAWAEFERLQGGMPGDADPDSGVDTQPSNDPAFAPTQPDTNGAALREADPSPPRARAGLSLQEVMVEARRFNRVCPKPAQWQQFYELLAAAGPGAKRGPPFPITGAAWSATPSMPKRMCLRDQLEWAEAHEALAPAMAFLKSLPEAQWHHMDDN